MLAELHCWNYPSGRMPQVGHCPPLRVRKKADRFTFRQAACYPEYYSRGEKYLQQKFSTILNHKIWYRFPVDTTTTHGWDEAQLHTLSTSELDWSRWLLSRSGHFTPGVQRIWSCETQKRSGHGEEHKNPWSSSVITPAVHLPMYVPARTATADQNTRETDLLRMPTTQFHAIWTARPPHWYSE